MGGIGGPRVLSRVRSHRKLRSTTAEKVDAGHRRQHSDSVTASSSTRSAAPTHRPALEWDPLKLNPPTPPAAGTPAGLRDSMPMPMPMPEPEPEPGLQRKRTFAGHEMCRPRMHHSDSGFALVVHEGFDFGFERDDPAGGRMIERHRSHEDGMHTKGWPSPTSSVDSDKSWPEDDDGGSHHNDEDGAVARSRQLWGAAPSPRRRPQVASPDDPKYFIQRGGWKRRGIVFGGQEEQAGQKEDEVLNMF